MSYINTNTKEIVSANDIMRIFPNVSFPDGAWSDEILSSFGFAELNRPNTHSFPQSNEILVDGEPYEENGKWYLPWVIQELSEEEINARLVAKRTAMVISPLQAKIALQNAGLFQSIEDYVNDPATDITIKLAWNNAIEFRRLSPMIVTLSQQFNLTEEQLDDLFVTAKNISV